MANGYCPALLRHINDIAEGNASANKLNVSGFLAMLFCCQNSFVSPVNDGNQSNGNTRSLTIKYRKRPTLSDVDTDDNCEINSIPSYSEWTIPNLSFVKTSWFLSDAEIQKYCDEASQLRTLGGGIPQVMNEHYLIFLERANILLRAINRSLVTSAATQFGNNVTTGGSGGKVININRSGTGYILDNGIVDMMRDIQENEICGEPCLVGGGLLSAWDMANNAACCNQAGLDMGRLGVPKFFFDKDTQQIWGQDTAGLFAQGSVKFIGRNKYTGVYAGQKGNSFFGTVPMPVSAFNCNVDDCLRDLVFDLQIRYIDCPTTIDVGGTPTTVNRGWEFILSKEFGLWIQPTDAYPTGDPLEDTNGTLKYFFTNTNDASAGAYGAYP